MKGTLRRKLLVTGLAALFVLPTACEYLFYSPAFMPVLSETELRIMEAPNDYEELYDGDQAAYGTWAYTVGPPDTLNVSAPNTTGRMIPALESLSFNDMSWHGVSEFLGMFFSTAALQLDTAVDQAGTANFHGYSFPFTYSSTLAAEYDLTYPAVEGISEGGPTSKLSGDLSIVTVNAEGPEDELRGEGTFVFGSGPDKFGLLYMVFYHDSGQTTMAYQLSTDSPGTGTYFPPGRYVYLINVFPH